MALARDRQGKNFKIHVIMFTKNLIKKNILSRRTAIINNNNLKNINRSLSTEVFAPMNTFKEDETQMREMVGNFARDIIGPKVAEMDKHSKMDEGIINSLFAFLFCLSFPFLLKEVGF